MVSMNYFVNKIVLSSRIGKIILNVLKVFFLISLYLAANEYLYIDFSGHDTLLEYSSLSSLIVKRFESQII